MFDIYLLLFHAGRLSHETRVVVRVSICAAHGVFIVAAAVDFTRTAATSKRCDDECDVCVTHNMTIRPPAPQQYLKLSFVSPWWSTDHSLRSIIETHSKLCFACWRRNIFPKARESRVLGSYSGSWMWSILFISTWHGNEKTKGKSKAGRKTFARKTFSELLHLPMRAELNSFQHSCFYVIHNGCCL